MNSAPNAPAALRNRDAILHILQQELRGEQRVLEIGSGTGQHAIHFAAALPELSWQTSDLAANHAGIHHWIIESGLTNVIEPLLLNVSEADGAGYLYSAIFSANTAHIMSKNSVEDMLNYVARSLQQSGKFILYGPFRVKGEFIGDGNKRFDQSLKAQDQAMGIRDLEWIDKLCGQLNLAWQNTHSMPANNLLVIWQKQQGE